MFTVLKGLHMYLLCCVQQWTAVWLFQTLKSEVVLSGRASPSRSNLISHIFVPLFKLKRSSKHCLIRSLTTIFESIWSAKPDMRKHEVVFLHDLFNIVCLSGIISIDVSYLYQATVWNHLGTGELGSDQTHLAALLLSSFFTYIVVDTIWIAANPTCVLSSPNALIIHHFFTFLFLLVPYYVPQFQWHGAVSIFVELNVLFLVWRRQFDQDSIIYKILDAIFLITWFLFRLIVFPFLLIFYSYEYIRYSNELGGEWFNIVLLAPLLQVIYIAITRIWIIISNIMLVNDRYYDNSGFTDK